MSRRHRRQGGGQAAQVGGREEVERLLEKGRIKDAFKQAKLCFREQANDENRRMLERVYLLRVKDLSHSGMPAAAAEVAKSFLDFGVSEPAAVGELAALLPRLGLMDEARRLGARLQAPEAQAALSVSFADLAVLHPDQTPASLADVRQGAARIRSALAALDEEQQERAIELLKDIPRNSPWADWRYFVRGLAAFRRGDREQAFANWERLDPQRAAQRIATALMALPADRVPGVAPGVVDRHDLSKVDLSRLEIAAFGEPVLARLDRLRRLVDKTNPKCDWKQALALMAPLTATLRRVDRRLAQRLTEILLPLVIDEATDRSLASGEKFVNEFIRAAEPLPLDPRWNRFWAFCWEEVDETVGAIGYWQSYLSDVNAIADIDADKRRQIQALVWWHIGRSLAEQARNVATPWAGDDPNDEVRGFRRRAVEALEESLRLDPTRRATHVLLIELCSEWDEPERAAEAARRLLQYFPDDLQALTSLGHYHFARNEPQEALEYARGARQVKPLDAAFKDLEHWSLLGLARMHALAGRWEEGRAAFASAEVLLPDDVTDYTVLARRALFELKAGEKQRSAELIERAKATLAETAPLWLVLAIEARRYELPAARAAEFNRELRPLLRKKKSGETAGKLAGHLVAYRHANIDYPEKDEHLQAVLGYVRATSRTKYTEQDLMHVCQLLSEADEESRLLGQLVRRGRKNFPNSPYFLVLAAEQELRRGPLHCDLAAARKQMEKALRLAEADPQGRYAELAAELKPKLAMLGSLDMMASELNQRFGRGDIDDDLAGFFDMMGAIDDFDDDPDGDEGSNDSGSGSFAEFLDFFQRGFTQANMPAGRPQRNRRRAK
jgi:tetratricopeptide (TPR) repeat protein